MFTIKSQDCYIAGYDPAPVDHKTALRFNSALQQSVRVPNNTTFNLLEAFTLNLWVKPAVSSTGAIQGIVMKDAWMEAFISATGGTFTMRARINTSTYTGVSSAFSVNRWYMLTMTHDKTTLRFYLNGTQFASTSAPGSLTANNNDMYFGRHVTGGTYSSLDLSKVKLWSYALSAGEVAALYQPAYRSHCIQAFIPGVEVFSDITSKRAYIASDIATTNPGTVSSSLGLCIPNDGVVDTQLCFIPGDGDSEVEWDTRIITAKTYVSWDTLVNVQGRSNAIVEIILGKVTYPITRDATKGLDIATSYNPHTVSTNTNCFLHAGFSPEPVVRNCYITAPSFAISRRMAFLQGSFNIITDSSPAYIVNNEVSDFVGAFIAGVFVFRHAVGHKGYVHGFVETITRNKSTYIAGINNIRSTKSCFIPAPAMMSGARHCFIMSTKTTDTAKLLTFIKGNVGAVRHHDCFIDGHFSATPTKMAFIPAMPIIQDSVWCFVQAEHRIKVLRAAFTKGWVGIVGSKALYLKAEVVAVDSEPCYVRGHVIRLIAKRAHVVGEAPTVVSITKNCYIVNGNPVSSKLAHIVSGPQTFQRCFINCLGDRTAIKAAYIVA